MSEQRRTAGAGPLAAYAEGMRVQTKEGYPGTIEDIHEGPRDLTTYYVALDNGQGGGEYAEAEIWPLPQTAAAVDHTAQDDYPELGTALVDHLPPEIKHTVAHLAAARSVAQPEDRNKTNQGQTCQNCGQPVLYSVSDHDWIHESNALRTCPKTAAVPLTCADCGLTYYTDNMADPHHTDCQQVNGVIAAAAMECPVCHKDATTITGQDGNLRKHNRPTEIPGGVASSTCAGSGQQPVEKEVPQWIRDTFDKESFYLPMNTDKDQKFDNPDEEKGWKDGTKDGKAGITRNIQDPTNIAYRAGYDRGWAYGIEIYRAPAGGFDFGDFQTIEQMQTVDPPRNRLGSLEVPPDAPSHEGLPFFEAGELWDLVKGKDPSNDPVLKGYQTYNWCRYRKDFTCYYSKTLNVEASQQAGYAVWVPEERGDCFRNAWDAQQACPIALPGPHVPGGFTDATKAWEEGGQHGGVPTNVTRAAAAEQSHWHFWSPLGTGEIFDFYCEASIEKSQALQKAKNAYSARTGALPGKPFQSEKVSEVPEEHTKESATDTSISTEASLPAGYALQYVKGGNTSNYAVVATFEGKAVGAVQWKPEREVWGGQWNADHTEIESMLIKRPPQIVDLKVDKAHQRKGLATAMYEEAKQHEPNLVHDDIVLPDGEAWMKSLSAADWNRHPEGMGWVRQDEEWWLERGAPMYGGRGTAWLVHKRQPEEKVGRDGHSPYDPHDGSILFLRDGNVAPDADHPGPLYKHIGDAGSLAEAKEWVRSHEERHGKTSALDPSLAFMLTATWREVQEKAKRIRADGYVRIIASKDGIVTAHVRGDTNVYETEVVRSPGARSNVASWTCGCKWAAYSWGRSGPWKKYEGRMCSHALALQYEAQARGMHGRTLTLDESQPEWMDSTVPVRTPNSYDRDKGRYSHLVTADQSTPETLGAWTESLTKMAEGLDLSDSDDRATFRLRVQDAAQGVRADLLRGVAADLGSDDTSRPAPRVLADAWISRTSAYRPATIQDDDDSPLMYVAKRTKSFPAKVWGKIVRLFIEDGEIHDVATGEEVAAKDVLFPGYDPVAGLDYVDPDGVHTGALTKTADEDTCPWCHGDGLETGKDVYQCQDCHQPFTLAQNRAMASTKTASPLDDARKAPDLSTAADHLLAAAHIEERTLTPLLTNIAAKEGGKMAGLEHRFKSKDSLLRKMRAEANLYPSPGECALNMSDALRYTMLLPDQTYTKTTQEVLGTLKGKGFAQRVKNFWQRGDTYNGINAAMTSPSGLVVELQFHTDPSIAAKADLHPIYEKWRTADDPQHRKTLAQQMVQIADTARPPPGVMSITPFKRTPGFEDAHAAVLAAVMTLEAAPRYLLVHDVDDAPLAVLRVDVDGDVARWIEGTWHEALEYGRFTYLGEPRSEEITESEAETYIGSGALVSYAHHEEKESPMSAEEWGVFADLHDVPEPALPTTDGGEEDEEGNSSVTVAGSVRGNGLRATYKEAEAELTTDWLDAVDVSGADQAAMAVAAALAVSQVSTASAEDLQAMAEANIASGGNDGDRDIMTAAQQGLEREALKDYSHAERQRIIAEGEDGDEAGNLDRLDLTGTHYEALEARRSTTAGATEATDLGWDLLGDPNGDL